MAEPRIDKECLDRMRELHDEFLQLLRGMDYADETVGIYDRYPANFMRWVAGEFEPQGPRGT